jgi:hypothetical protein
MRAMPVNHNALEDSTWRDLFVIEGQFENILNAEKYTLRIYSFNTQTPNSAPAPSPIPSPPPINAAGPAYRAFV